jgi:hypothetical protein
MLLRILLASILAAPFSAWAQYVTVGPNGQVVPAGNTVVVMGNGGGPTLSTPSITFATPAPAAGISLADRAGISERAPSNTAVPSASETAPVNGYNSLPNEAAQSAAPENAEAVPAAVNNTGRLINDVGPSSFAGAAYSSGASVAANGATGSAGPSLGELAAKYKAERPQNIKTYTNADALRLSDTMNVHGANVNPVSAQNTVPPAPQAQPSATAGAQASAAPQLSANARPSPGIPAPATQASAAQNTESAPQTQESPTTPQVSQKPQRNQNGNEDNGKSLPASSTLLPLFGLLGLGFGAAGLWLRKYFG